MKRDIIKELDEIKAKFLESILAEIQENIRKEQHKELNNE